MENEIIEVGQGGLSAVVREEIDIQIATAKAWPRNIKKALDNSKALATVTQPIAASMGYALPRGGKKITGPSVRLAEAVASQWGNLRYAARIVEVGAKFVIAEGMCHDLENNVAVSVSASRRITNKEGKRYNDDMIQTTSQAACSIALRNAIMRVVPRSYIDEVYREAMDVAFGKAYELEVQRTNALDYFAGLGAPNDWVLASIDRKSIQEVTRDDMKILSGFKTSLEEGTADIYSLFPDPSEEKDDGKKKPQQAGLDGLTQSTKEDLGKKEDPAKKEPEQQPQGAAAGKEEPSPPSDPDPVYKARRRKTDIGNDIKTCGITAEQFDKLDDLKETVGEHEAIIGDFFRTTDIKPNYHGDCTFLTATEAAQLLKNLEAATGAGGSQELVAFPFEEGGKAIYTKSDGDTEKVEIVEINKTATGYIVDIINAKSDVLTVSASQLSKT